MTNEERNRRREKGQRRQARGAGKGPGGLAGGKRVRLALAALVADFVLFVTLRLFDIGWCKRQNAARTTQSGKIRRGKRRSPGALLLTAQRGQRGVILIPQGCNFAAGAWREEACKFRRYHGTACITLSGPVK